MKIAVVDGQGGKLGRQLVEKIFPNPAKNMIQYTRLIMTRGEAKW